MTIKVAINGYGRIGRNVLRAHYEDGKKHDIAIVAINDLGSPETNAHLTRYDTAHGKFPGKIAVDGDSMVVDGDRIRVFAQRDPAQLPWGSLGVDVVLECTGLFTTKEKASAHLKGGARKVIISAPGGKDVDATVVYGVNHDRLKASDTVISNASCTTNCLAPLVKPLHDKIGVVSGLMTTVHAYTNDQVLTDVYHEDLRRARSATMSMAQICAEAEKSDTVELDRDFLDRTFTRIDQSIAMATLFTAFHLKVKAIASLTDSGSTALWMSRHDCGCPIFALTPKVETQRRMALLRNVTSLFLEQSTDRDEVLRAAEDLLLAQSHVQRGDMADPLTDDEIDAATAPDDGLPVSLAAVIARYRNRWFKVKLCGDITADVARLSAVAPVLESVGAYRVTLDGNEQFPDTASLAALVGALRAEKRLGRLVEALRYIEQPFPRAIALDTDVHGLLDGMPLIIDESDATLDAFPHARALGYAGVSSKNCKGVYKSVLNAARCARWNAPQESEPAFMTGEDLTAQPGLAVQQDLALAALLGLTHVERNGHHYAAGFAGQHGTHNGASALIE